MEALAMKGESGAGDQRRLAEALEHLEDQVARSQRGGFGTTFKAFVIGALVGAGAALFYAPQRGEELRQQMQQRSSQMKEQATQLAGQVQQSVGQVKDQAQQSASQIKDQAQQSANQLQPAAQQAANQAMGQSQPAQPTR
jgi:gas vesicle protein